ncbi:MAG: hypothetical protein WCO71_07750 [Pseudomonadota bacterium]
MQISATLITTLGIFLAGCSTQRFSDGATKTKDKSVPSPAAESATDTPTVEGAPPLLLSLQTHEAVFAVRNLSCALCHGKVDSNIISDFAKSTDEASADEAFRDFLTLTTVGATANSKPYIDKYPPEIAGKFIIPTGDISIAKNYVGGDKAVDCTQLQPLGPKSMAKISILNAVKKCVEPKFKWGAGSEKFVATAKIEITPVFIPADVKALGDANIISDKGFAPLAVSSIDGMTGNTTLGFKAGAKVNCEGAVVFDGPVLLRNTVINTQKGCRIYSTASIFIFGALTVVGAAESANLQILSPLYVGFDMPVTGQCRAEWPGCLSGEGLLQWRLVTYGGVRAQKFSRGTGAEVYAAIKADGAKLGINALVGSGSEDYSRIAVSAPVVYSRSSGKFSGVVVAEQFLGKIGSLSFVFDPVFKPGNNSPVLFPEIKNPMVVVE